MFRPYHAFGHSVRLERSIANLQSTGAIAVASYDAYKKYHFSLIHKLKSAQLHVEALRDYLSAQGDASAQADPIELVHRANFHFDGFLYVLGSSLDIFAREVLTYFGIALPRRVYFKTARDQIARHRANDPFLPRLNNPSWKAEFSDYRNTATHESLVGTTFQLKYEVDGNQTSQKLVFPLPDDPRDPSSDSKRNGDVVAYSETTLKRALRYINTAYGDINSRIQAQGGFPI